MNKKAAVFWLIYFSVLFLVISIERIERTKTGYDIAEKTALIEQKQARNDYLAFEIEKIKCTENLLLKAQTAFNLDIAEPSKIVVLEELYLEKHPNYKKTIAKLVSP